MDCRSPSVPSTCSKGEGPLRGAFALPTSPTMALPSKIYSTTFGGASAVGPMLHRSAVPACERSRGELTTGQLGATYRRSIDIVATLCYITETQTGGAGMPRTRSLSRQELKNSAVALKNLREEARLTQTAVARACGVSKTTVSRAEDEKLEKPVSVTAIEKLCHFHHVNVRDVTDPGFGAYIVRGKGVAPSEPGQTPSGTAELRWDEERRRGGVATYCHIELGLAEEEGGFVRRNLQVSMWQLEPNGDTDHFARHYGEEIIHVVAGRIDMHFDLPGQAARVEQLDQGDSIHFRAAIPHHAANPDASEPARLFVVHQPPLNRIGAPGA